MARYGHVAKELEGGNHVEANAGLDIHSCNGTTNSSWTTMAPPLTKRAEEIMGRLLDSWFALSSPNHPKVQRIFALLLLTLRH
jgi:hypothetical protein